MGITHARKHHQGLSDLDDFVQKHILTDGWGSYGAAKETEALPGDRDIQWQGEVGGITVLGDAYQRLASVELETNRGDLTFHNVQCSRGAPRRAHQGAVVEVSGIQGRLDTLNNGVES